MTSDTHVDKFLERLGRSIPVDPCNTDAASVCVISSIEEACRLAWDDYFGFDLEWGASMGFDISRPDECQLNWTDLRENLVAKLIYTTEYFDQKDLYDPEGEICEYVWNRLVIADGAVELHDDICADLGNCAMNVRLNEGRNFWSDLSQVYLSGLIPCGWRGTYPDGQFIALQLDAEQDTPTPDGAG